MDKVTPDLRGVAASWHDGVGARFVYARPISSEMNELVREVETEVAADFPPDVTVILSAEHLPNDRPRTLAEAEWWVYLRREQ
jgi:hypothetical protein